MRQRSGHHSPQCLPPFVHHVPAVLTMPVTALSPYDPVHGLPWRRRTHVLLGLHNLMRRKAQLAHVALRVDALMHGCVCTRRFRILRPLSCTRYGSSMRFNKHSAFCKH